jgi:hypothetical protein
MRPMAVALVAAFAVGAVATANAQSNPRLRRVEPLPPGSTTIITRDEFGRTRTRVMVQKRSYLDGGTEVMPGTYQPANGVHLYGQRPTDGLGPNDITNPRGPIPDPFFLPGKNNPWPWFQQ